MALDNTVLNIIVEEIKNELIGGFFDHSFSLSYSHFAFPYHSGKNTENKGRGTLIISMDPSEPFITYSFDKFTKVEDNSAFGNILKRIAGTKITDIYKTKNERVITIETEVIKPELDITVTHYKIVIELVPQLPNCYIINAETNKIIALYKEHGDILSPRYMSRGMNFIPLQEREDHSNNYSNIDELRPYFSRSVLFYLKSYADKIGLKEAVNKVEKSKDLYVTPKGIMPFSFDLPEAKIIKVNDIYNYYVSDQKKIAMNIKEKKLRDLLNTYLKTAVKKLNNLKSDVETSKKRLIYKDYGQILFLYQTEDDGTMTKLNKDGYSVPIDNSLTFVENANLYFKKYHKAKLAIPILEKLILQTEDDIKYLQKKLLDLENGSPRDILELKSELMETGYIKNAGKKGIKKASSKKKYEPHYLVLEHGKIGYGMNDLQNESLTFDIAPIQSLFFHVVDHPGAHVVLLSGTDKLKYRELAAELALYISHLSEGDVYMAKVKDVKKNKSKKGLVNIMKFETITIHKVKESSLELFKTLK